MTPAFPLRKRGRPPKPPAVLDSDAARQLRPRFGDLSDWERAIFAAFPESELFERLSLIRDVMRTAAAARIPAVPAKTEPQS